MTPWTVAWQAPLSLGFPRQEYWKGMPFPSPADLPNPGIEPVSPALAGKFFTQSYQQSPCVCVLFHCSVMSDSLRPHGLQHSPCSSPTLRACSNSCPLSWWCHPTVSSSGVPFSSCLQSIPASIRVFSTEVALRIRWPKYRNFSFSISPSSEYSGLISFKICSSKV